MDLQQFAQGVVMFRQPESVADAKHTSAHPPPAEHRFLNEATMVTDLNDNIVVVYLPDILPSPSKVCVLIT
jgi:hypothetical protein